MGRGRGRGRKLTNGRSHEDKGSSGEEVVPARKRRGRPQKRIADKVVDQAEAKNLAEGDDDDADYQQGEGEDGGAKPKASRTEKSSAGKGTKRNRLPKDEGSNLDLEENSSSTRSSNDESTRSNGFRQNGSRRKSTPRRAAEAGI
uniref:Uncharacterized protein n=1 Tax=Oryza punctata TaxID=4537 RepID=A0A0E0LB28_ORYPU